MIFEMIEYKKDVEINYPNLFDFICVELNQLEYSKDDYSTRKILTKNITIQNKNFKLFAYVDIGFTSKISDFFIYDDLELIQNYRLEAMLIYDIHKLEMLDFHMFLKEKGVI